jgi:hypothetical protein
MRRSPIVLTATIAGTAGVLAFHPHAPTQSLQSARDKLGFKAADGSRATLQVPEGGFH